MVFYVWYGEISDERKENWDSRSDNPFKVLKWHKSISGLDWYQFLGFARTYFKDEIQIDWGSFAWKGDAGSIKKLVKSCNCAEIADSSCLEDGVEYGIVFIEMS